MSENTQIHHIEPPRLIVYAVAGTLAILSLFLLVEAVNAAGELGRPATPATNVITVQGTGRASAVPDIASVNYTVTESAATVAAAQTAATKKSDAAIAALKDLGIAEKDIKTLSYNINPKYDTSYPCSPGTFCPANAVVRSAPKIVGYEVSQTVEVKVRDTAKAGDVLQKLGTLEVQNVYGPNFTMDDDSAVHDQARAEAIADAQKQAAKLAKELGVHLGPVTSFSEGGSYPYPMYKSAVGMGGVAMDSAASAPALPVGENETTVNVSITYEIR